jgi:hypothetical protein
MTTAAAMAIAEKTRQQVDGHREREPVAELHAGRRGDGGDGGRDELGGSAPYWKASTVI